MQTLGGRIQLETPPELKVAASLFIVDALKAATTALYLAKFCGFLS
jgi:hypothetical protein